GWGRLQPAVAGLSPGAPVCTHYPAIGALGYAEIISHRVLILGGGFGGLYAARKLARAPVDVTLIDRRNFHLFQPLLYQVATGSLSPGEVCAPLRSILSRQENTRVLM